MTSIAFVLATSSQAETLFDIGRTYYLKYCEIIGKRQRNGILLAVEPIREPRVADEDAGFRDVLVVAPGSTGWGDLILFRTGRVFGELTFSRPGKAFPAELERSIIKRFAERLHV